MIITKLTILDMKNQEANSFCFKKGANIISSVSNTVGKSSLIKSMYYGLGLNIKKFPSKWNYNDMIFKIDYLDKGEEKYIVRSRKNFWIKNNKKSLNEKDYGLWLCNEFNIKLKLPLNINNQIEEEMGDLYASAPLSLFFIDQDNSWKGTPYKNTVNLGMYKSQSIPKYIFEYFLGLYNDSLVDLQAEKTLLKNNISTLDKKYEALNDLSENLVKKEEFITNFNENEVKQEVETYLKLAQSLSTKIKKFKASIYTKQMQLDDLMLENREVTEILNFLTSSYNKISCKCKLCNSKLTKEQSIQRMKIDDNKISLKVYQEDILNKTNNLKKEIEEEKKRELSLTEEYKELLNVSEVKQGEITLKEYIEEKAKIETNKIYYNVKGDILEEQEKLKSKLILIEKDIRNINKSIKDKKNEIKSDFDMFLLSAVKKLKDVKLDYEFLKFNEIKETGAVNNKVYCALYLAYTKILTKYSFFKFPFAFDSIVKDEWDSNTEKDIYELADSVLLDSNIEQSFFIMLKDKINYLKSDYNLIELEEDRLLKKENFSILEKQIEEIIKV
ncbi:MAG: hypothetical protein N4A43_02255 [Alphaproteobacteria bacterium]|jgi:hypothetical protein|nr:hypothetical protein [Alphaproteobacteria bacterium]